MRLIVAAGYHLLQNQNRIVRVEGSIRCTATSSHYFLRQPTIFRNFQSLMVAVASSADTGYPDNVQLSPSSDRDGHFSEVRAACHVAECTSFSRFLLLARFWKAPPVHET